MSVKLFVFPPEPMSIHIFEQKVYLVNCSNPMINTKCYASKKRFYESINIIKTSHLKLQKPF